LATLGRKGRQCPSLIKEIVFEIEVKPDERPQAVEVERPRRIVARADGQFVIAVSSHD